MPMETDRSGEDEEPREPTYMPIVPAGMSTSAPAPQVCLHMQLSGIILLHICAGVHPVTLTQQSSGGATLKAFKGSSAPWTSLRRVEIITCSTLGVA